MVDCWLPCLFAKRQVSKRSVHLISFLPAKFQSVSKKILAAYFSPPLLQTNAELAAYRELDPPQKKDVHISSPKTFIKLHDYHPDGAGLIQESCEEKLYHHKAMIF